MGASAGFLNGLLHKQLIGDLFLAKRDPARLEAAGKKDLVPTLQAIADDVLKNPARFVDILREKRDFLSCQLPDLHQGSKTRATASARTSPKPTRRRSPPSSPPCKDGSRTPCDCPHHLPAPDPCCRPRPRRLQQAGAAAQHRPSPPTTRPTQSKMDLAQVDYKYPMSAAELAKITPTTWPSSTRSRSTRSTPASPPAPSRRRLRRPHPAAAGEQRQVPAVRDRRRLHRHGAAPQGPGDRGVGEALWRGKVFFRDERVLRNRIEDLSLLKKMGLVEGEPKKMNFGGKETWLLFPAKLYCGQSLLDARRESIIIDYFFTDEIPGYQESPDLPRRPPRPAVRDEIRMIRPGFYLGRAYLDRGFALNFTLYDKATDDKARDDFVKTGKVQEDCWPGTQARKLLAAAGS
jgi:hypothetical protein